MAIQLDADVVIIINKMERFPIDLGAGRQSPKRRPVPLASFRYNYNGRPRENSALAIDRTGLQVAAMIDVNRCELVVFAQNVADAIAVAELAQRRQLHCSSSMWSYQ